MQAYLLLSVIFSTITQAAPLAMPNPSYDCDPVTDLCSPVSSDSESISTEAPASSFETFFTKANPIDDALDVQSEIDGAYPIASQDVQSETPKGKPSGLESSESQDPAPLSLFPTCNQYHECKICNYKDRTHVYCDPAVMYFDKKSTLEKPVYKVCYTTLLGPGHCYLWDGELMNE